MSRDQIAAEAIRNDHELIYEVASEHNWVVEHVRDTRYFLYAVKAKIFNSMSTFLSDERDSFAD